MHDKSQPIGLIAPEKYAQGRSVDAALKDAQDHLRLAIEATDVGIYDYDLTTGELRWDTRTRALFGLPPDATVTYEGAFLAGLHPDDRERAQHAVQDALAPEGSGLFDIEYRTVGLTDNVTRWIAARGKAHREGGQTVRFVGTVRDISKRKNAEAELEQTVERYRLVTLATNDAIWDWDLVANHVLWNESLYTGYGYRLVDVQPTSEWWLDKIHPADRSRVEQDIRSVIASAANEWSHEYRFRRGDGQYSEVLDRGYMVRDASGAPLRMIGAMLDITDRKAAEQQLRESEARFRFLDALASEIATSRNASEILSTTTRMLGEHLGVSICAYADMDVDEDGFTIRGDWSAPGSATIVGHYSLAAFGKLAVQNLRGGAPLIVSDNLKELAPHEAATFQSIGISATICMPLVKAGRLTALMAIHDKNPRQWTSVELAMLREVTERSWAHIERVGSEAELRRSEENFRTLARAMPAQVWTSRPDGSLDWFNDQVYTYSGTAPGSLDGSGWTALVHPDDLAQSRERWARSLDAKTTYETEFRLRSADGVWRWHISRAVPIIGSFGEVIRWVGTNTDIEDQKEVERSLADINATLENRVKERTDELVRAQDALRQSQKMEAVGQLTGGLAHDFNNLLAGIMGSLEFLEKRMAEGRLSGVERYITGARDSARRAAALTQRLLAFSRRQTLDPKPVNLNRLVSGMEELIRRSVGPSVEVEVVGAGGLWTTCLDVSQLESALLNLCINARDAMAPNGGHLTIETANKWLDERAASDRDLTPGQYVSLCVTDTGTGMTQNVMERAFDPFFTTKPVGQGTGLGLSMTYGFVRQSGGQVRIYSELGSGTTMCLYFPRHIGDALEEAVAADIEPAAGRGETVLVIDDEPLVRMLVTDVLEENGYSYLEAVDGPSGLKFLESKARIDLLITDVGLPGGMDGRQVAHAARVLRPDLKVLFVTGYAENAAIRSGLLEPGMELVTKPFNTTMLGSKIRALLDC
jgi:PAS domain S-box-containing protein